MTIMWNDNIYTGGRRKNRHRRRRHWQRIRHVVVCFEQFLQRDNPNEHITRQSEKSEMRIKVKNKIKILSSVDTLEDLLGRYGNNSREWKGFKNNL